MTKTKKRAYAHAGVDVDLAIESKQQIHSLVATSFGAREATILLEARIAAERIPEGCSFKAP